MPIIEVVANNTRLEKPGWTYVLDTGHDPTKASIQQPGSRKRNARLLEMTEGNLSSKQSTALARRLAEYDKDNARDVAVPLPPKTRTKPKTAATKKIIDSQRSFAHYMADEEAAAILDSESGQGKQRAAARSKSEANVTTAHEALGTSDADAKPDSSSDSRENGGLQGAATHQSLLPGEARLLQVSTPTMPSDALWQFLTSTNPASWNEVRAKPSSSGVPPRKFCDICGYWGRIKCIFCGARLCGLQCKSAHDEDRCQKYLG